MNNVRIFFIKLIYGFETYIYCTNIILFSTINSLPLIMIIQHLQMKIVLTLVLVIRKLQGCVVLKEWLSSVQDPNQDQDHREIYRQGKIMLTDKG